MASQCNNRFSLDSHLLSRLELQEQASQACLICQDFSEQACLQEGVRQEPQQLEQDLRIHQGCQQDFSIFSIWWIRCLHLLLHRLHKVLARLVECLVEQAFRLWVVWVTSSRQCKCQILLNLWALTLIISSRTMVKILDPLEILWQI